MINAMSPSPIVARRGLLFTVAGLLLLGGCGTAGSSVPSTPGAESVARAPLDSQASADRLHEIAGCLLMYHVRNGRFPPTLAALAAEPDLGCPPPVSPASGEAYVYHLPPLPMRGRPGSLLIHEPAPYAAASATFGEPVHWALLIDDRAGRPAIGTQVIFVAATEIDAAKQAVARD